MRIYSFCQNCSSYWHFALLMRAILTTGHLFLIQWIVRTDTHPMVLWASVVGQYILGLIFDRIRSRSVSDR